MGFSGKRVIVALCMWLSTISSAKLPRIEQPTKGYDSLRFLVVGDWGRNGDFNQSDVAFQMGKIGEELDIDFVISTGDNFYDNGLKGETDPAFIQSFTNVYTAKSLQTQWFSEIAEIFFVDTTPFVTEYFRKPDHKYDWRGVIPIRSYNSNALKDLESALKESRAKWKFVVGHHAIRSVGHHGDTPELVKYLLPILQGNNVDFYMNGHDHCLERISDDKSPIQFLTSGSGSKAWRGDLKNMHEKGLKFFYDGPGFMAVQIAQDEVEIAFYDVFGNVLHKWGRSKQLISDL